MTVSLPQKALSGIVAAAILAPSGHNTQPWRFVLTANGVDLLADRSRRLPVADPDDRELTISCGAALFNLRAAAADAGAWVDVVLFPRGGGPDLLARTTLASDDPDPDLARLARAIPMRHTYRRRFTDRPVDPQVAATLIEAAAGEGARLHVLGEAEREAAAALVGEGDAAQWADRGWRRELAEWMRPARDGDGLKVPGLALPAAQAIVRSFDMGGGIAARDRDLTRGSPLLVAVVTPGDTARDWLMAGQALERVLLTGVLSGLQASYLNQPMQVPRLRPRFAEAIGTSGSPQLLVRMGHPDGTGSHAPRRPLAEVIAG